MRELFRVQGSPDQRISAIAGIQRGRIARRQLLAAALTKSAIDRMLAKGRLQPRRYGVYAVGHAAPVDLARETEALLACPDGAVLSHHSAAYIWGLRPPPHGSTPVDVTIAQHTAVRKPGIRAHRTRALHHKDCRIHRGLPVVSPARALLEIAGECTEEEVEHALDDALNGNLTRPSQIREMLARAGHGRRGAKLLKKLLANRDKGGRSRSHPERTLRELIVAAELPPFEMNTRILTFDVDFAWPELKVIVEDDSFRYHGSRAKFESDRQRDQILQADGWTVIRFTARQIRNRPFAVIARLAAAIALAQARRQAAA